MDYKKIFKIIKFFKQPQKESIYFPINLNLMGGHQMGIRHAMSLSGLAEEFRQVLGFKVRRGLPDRQHN